MLIQRHAPSAITEGQGLRNGSASVPRLLRPSLLSFIIAAVAGVLLLLFLLFIVIKQYAYIYKFS